MPKESIRPIKSDAMQIGRVTVARAECFTLIGPPDGKIDDNLE